MDDSTFSFALTGVVPPVCDAEAGERFGGQSSIRRHDSAGNGPAAGFAVRKIRSVMAQLCSAIRSALDDERSTAEDSLRRAAEILQELGATEAMTRQQIRGGLSPWQIRKVTGHVEAQAHLSRLFRRIVGESPRAWRRARSGEPVECA
jgi:hypothetical protein